MPICLLCEGDFETDKFHPHQKYCSRKCKGNANTRANYHKYREHKLKVKRQRDLQVSYGITVEDYDRMYNDQHGRCALCGRHQSEFKRRLAVDHCHQTGKVRGLLCVRCNRALGNLDDNVELLQKAIQYLNN